MQQRVRFIMGVSNGQEFGCERRNTGCAADRLFEGALRLAPHSSFALSGAQIARRMSNALPCRRNRCSDTERAAANLSGKRWSARLERRAVGPEDEIEGTTEKAIDVLEIGRWRILRRVRYEGAGQKHRREADRAILVIVR